MVIIMVSYVFVVGVLAGMASAALFWVGASSAFVLTGFGILLLLCGFLSSALASVVASHPEVESDEPIFKTARLR